MSKAPTAAARYLDAIQASEYLGVSRRYLYDLINAGLITHTRLTKPSGDPGEYRFLPEDLDAYMKAQQRTAAQS